jgi:hypothetical protein
MGESDPRNRTTLAKMNVTTDCCANEHGGPLPGSNLVGVIFPSGEGQSKWTPTPAQFQYFWTAITCQSQRAALASNGPLGQDHRPQFAMHDRNDVDAVRQIGLPARQNSVPWMATMVLDRHQPEIVTSFCTHLTSNSCHGGVGQVSRRAISPGFESDGSRI